MSHVNLIDQEGLRSLFRYIRPYYESDRPTLNHIVASYSTKRILWKNKSIELEKANVVLAVASCRHRFAALASTYVDRIYLNL